MRSIIFVFLASALVIGCGSPESKPDDYFDSVNQTRAQREAEARRIAGLNNDIVDTSRPITSAGTGSNGDAIQQEIDRLLAAERAQNAQSAEPTPAAEIAPETDVAAAGTQAPVEEQSSISDSQDFEAVTARETIETDAAKLEALKQTYKVFEPESLTLRGQGVKLASFASDNLDRRVGRKRFSRRKSDYKSANFCADYSDQDLAQIAFLNRGGPRKDPLLLDADGDGFACGWTPRAYQSRLASRRASAAAQ